MLEEFLMQRIDALEASNADYRANEIELTTYIYTLLERDTPEEYKEVVLKFKRKNKKSYSFLTKAGEEFQRGY